jgi:hypothetical protein
MTNEDTIPSNDGFDKADFADILCAAAPCTRTDCCVKCSQQGVDPIRDKDFTQTNNDGTPSSYPVQPAGSNDWARSGSYVHPLFVGSSSAECVEFVAGLNELSGLTGNSVSKVQCEPWESDNTIAIGGTPVPSTYTENEASPVVGYALKVPGGAGVEASDATNCDAAAAAINALLTPYVIGVGDPDCKKGTVVHPCTVTPLVSCEAEYCSSDMKCIVRLTSPIFVDSVFDSGELNPQFLTMISWVQQINTLVLTFYCDSAVDAMCDVDEQARFEERSCNDVQGITQEDCEIPLFYSGLGPRPAAVGVPWPSMSNTFVSRDDVGQTSLKWLDMQSPLRASTANQFSSATVNGGFTISNTDDDYTDRNGPYPGGTDDDYFIKSFVDVLINGGLIDDYDSCLQDPFCNTQLQFEGRNAGTTWKRGEINSVYGASAGAWPGDTSGRLDRTDPHDREATKLGVYTFLSTGRFTRNTPCFPHQLNGLDKWDEQCFGQIRSRRTPDGYTHDYEAASFVDPYKSLASGVHWQCIAGSCDVAGISRFYTDIARDSADDAAVTDLGVTNTEYVIGLVAKYLRVEVNRNVVEADKGKYTDQNPYLSDADWWVPTSDTTWDVYKCETPLYYNLPASNGWTSTTNSATHVFKGSETVNLATEFTAGGTTANVVDNTGFVLGDQVVIAAGTLSEEILVVAAVDANGVDITFANAAANTHAIGVSMAPDLGLATYRRIDGANAAVRDYWIPRGLMSWDVYPTKPSSYDLASGGDWEGWGDFYLHRLDFNAVPDDQTGAFTRYYPDLDTFDWWQPIIDATNSRSFNIFEFRPHVDLALGNDWTHDAGATVEFVPVVPAMGSLAAYTMQVLAGAINGQNTPQFWVPSWAGDEKWLIFNAQPINYNLAGGSNAGNPWTTNIVDAEYVPPALPLGPFGIGAGAQPWTNGVPVPPPPPPTYKTIAFEITGNNLPTEFQRVDSAVPGIALDTWVRTGRYTWDVLDLLGALACTAKVNAATGVITTTGCKDLFGADSQTSVFTPSVSPNVNDDVGWNAADATSDFLRQQSAYSATH